MAVSEDQNRNHGYDQDGDLEQYGVWVKVDPEDVEESDEEALDLADLGDDAFDDTEADLLGFEEDDSLDDLLTGLTDDETDADQDADMILESIPLETVDESTPGESMPEPSQESFDDEEPLDLEELTVQDETTDFGEPMDLDEDELLFLEEEEEDDEAPEATLEDLYAGPATESTGPDEQAEQTESNELDEDPVGDPDDLTLDLDSLDVDAFDERPASAEETELETDHLEDDELDLDALDLDEELSSADLISPRTDEPDAEAFTTAAANSELPELEADESLSDELDLDDIFDDVSAVEQEMSDGPTDTRADGDTKAGETSPSFLETIERELSSIRTELSDLKRELSELRSRPAARSDQEYADTGTDDAGGFFEDEGDEDETIALTGAELDNIMNTAEFTEQPGRPTDLDDAMPGQESASTPEQRPDVADEIIPDVIDEIILEEAPQDMDVLDLALEDDSAAETENVSVPDEERIDFVDLDEEVEVLASMDIDAELADIEELADLEEFESEELSELEAPEEELEPLDLEEAPDPPQDDDAAELLEAEPEPAAVGLPGTGSMPIPENLKGELRSVLNYMDKLLDSLPEEKIQEFAASEHFKVYKRLFEELGLEQ